jgi:hypothetical protein
MGSVMAMRFPLASYSNVVRLPRGSVMLAPLLNVGSYRV